MPTVLTSIRLPQELYEWLKDKAEKENRTISNTLISALIDEKKKPICRMNEDCTEVICSECGACMDNEIYYMFKREKGELRYCPCCGRKIVIG